MAEPIRLDYAANDAEVIAAFKRQQAEIERERGAREKLQKQITENASTQRKADAEAAASVRELARQQEKLATDAARISEAVRTPLQQYKVSLAGLIDHYKSGRITQDEYHAATAKLKATYDEQTGKTARLKEAERLRNEQVREALKITERLRTANDRYAANVAKITELHKKGHLSAEDYNKALEAEQSALDESSVAGEKHGGVIDSMGVKWAAVGAAGAMAMRSIASELSDLQATMKEANVEYDKMARKLGIQGGLSDAERKEQASIVGNVAIDAGVQIDKAFETATQLSSSGFKDPVKGGTLNTALALMQSSNQIDGDAAGFIKGSGQFLNAFGMEKNSANLLDLGTRMQGLFKSTDVQAADLPDFAKAAPVLSGAGLSLEQSLSALTALRESMGAGEAATGARNVVSMLQTAGTNSTAVGALKKIGLSPDQIDIQGEGLMASLQTLKGATGRMQEADRAQVLTQIFGRENVATASILMNSTGKFGEYAQMQQAGRTGFRADVRTAREGIAADANRVEVKKMMDSVEHDEEVRNQEAMKAGRIAIRDRTMMREWARGGVTGRLSAAAIGIGGAIDDSLIKPITGEKILGAGHAAEVSSIQNKNGEAMARERRLFAGMAGEGGGNELVPLMKQQNELLKEMKNQGAQKAHAGVVGNRVKEGAKE